MICMSLLAVLCSCGKPSATSQTTISTESSANQSERVENNETGSVYAHVGEKVFEITLSDNSSAQAFYELCKSGDVKVDMSDYGGFEKVGSLETKLVTNDENITAQPGDVILYQGDKITLYYGENTWNFTRLGKINGVTRDELLASLGDGDVKMTFSLKK